jgi:site-specific DNA-methyltransferase (adenine-specific)
MNLILGDCLEKLKELPDNSIDSIVTDPPYHLISIVKRFGKSNSAPAQYGTDGAFIRASKGFMGKEWDGGDIAQRPDVWIECLRVLKPGGHMVAFSGSRTYHRMAVAIEDAGFDIRDQIMWVYGSGFPKSHNVGNGIGTALKPAHEPIVLARKPLSEKTIAENVIKWGTGGLNIDDCRIEYKDDKPKGMSNERTNEDSVWKTDSGFYDRTEDWEPNNTGRWPANIILDEEAGEILDQQSGIKQYNKGREEGNYKGGHRKDYVGTEDNPIVNKIEGKFFSDKGGASRFFYCPKTSKKDRDEGLDGFEDKQIYTEENGKFGYGNKDGDNFGDRIENVKRKNHHPTVKPTELMLYLIKLVTPVNGTVMDCFMGSGSTGKAAVRGGFDFIGIEREEEYLKIAEARINNEITPQV